MVSSPRVKINPAVLTWAREWFNMSTAYVAKKMGQKEETIIAWESGEKQPTYIQLKNLAKYLEKPLEVFLYPNVPDIPKPSALYRSSYGNSTETIPPEILIIITHARNYQNNLREVTHGQNPSDNFILDNIFPENIEQTAIKVREILGINLEEQKKIGQSKSKETWREAFDTWRDAFARCGIYVYKQPFKNDAYSGFCLVDREFPVICVNNSLGHQRQTFTLFHELYHLIHQLNGIDLTTEKTQFTSTNSENKKIEQYCDKFAAEFLVPTNDFRKEIMQIPQHTKLFEAGNYSDIMNGAVRPLSKKYSVSQDVILRKLSELEYITSVKAYSLYKIHKPDIYRNHDEGDVSSGGNHYNNKVAYLGKPYINLVMESQEKYNLPDYIVAEYLDTPASKLQILIESAIKGDGK